MPDKGLFVVDTSDLFAGLEGASTGDRRSLVRLCNHLQIQTENLHNAGNDAYVSHYVSCRLNATLTCYV
jgi:DNA polymerase III epsilon subunit-like protein